MTQRKILYKQEVKQKIFLKNFPVIKKSLDENLNCGFTILDKPQGPTSHEIAAWIKREFNIPVTHSGTLENLGKSRCIRFTFNSLWQS